MERDGSLRGEAEQDATGTQSVERATSLLMLIGRADQAGAGIAEIVARSGLKAPTARRILNALIRAGLVEQDDASRRYFLGPESYVLGMLAADRFGIHRLALGSLVRLAQQSEDTAFLTVRRGSFSVCLHREDGAYPIRSHVLGSGDRHPLGVAAGGIALLAALPEPEMHTIIDEHATAYRNDYPMLPLETLLTLLAETRSRGFAVNPGVFFPGSWGIAVAIRDARGAATAALSIAAIESRMDSRRQGELAAMLLEEAGRLEAQLSSPRRVGDGGAAMDAAPPSRTHRRQLAERAW